MRRPKNRVAATLDVKKVIEQFQKAEASTAHRKGTFKISLPFEDALKKIVKTKLGRKR